jgi:hypothetical protein
VELENRSKFKRESGPPVSGFQRPLACARMTRVAACAPSCHRHSGCHHVEPWRRSAAHPLLCATWRSRATPVPHLHSTLKANRHYIYCSAPLRRRWAVRHALAWFVGAATLLTFLFRFEQDMDVGTASIVRISSRRRRQASASPVSSSAVHNLFLLPLTWAAPSTPHTPHIVQDHHRWGFCPTIAPLLRELPTAMSLPDEIRALPLCSRCTGASPRHPAHRRWSRHPGRRALALVRHAWPRRMWPRRAPVGSGCRSWANGVSRPGQPCELGCRCGVGRFQPNSLFDFFFI